ncbi:MAG: GlsB/YeaQ/YmgE family stress response membrane protein [Acidobacteriaceae bacterium]
MFALIWEAVIGLIVGALAKLIMPGKDPGGIFVTMLLGVAASIGMGFLGRAVGWYQPGQSAGFFASVVGAIIILLLYRLLVRGSAPRTLSRR